MVCKNDKIKGIDDLLEPFYEAEKPRSRFRVGIEAEKFGVYADNGLPLSYYGPRGVQAIFRQLCEHFGWIEEREFSKGEVIALRRKNVSLTLEPGAQLELSSAPHDTIHGICAEFRGHMEELQYISDKIGVVWFGLGFHPFARQDDLPWVPKLRYGIMRKYLPTKGNRALDMMRRTGTIQANLDYSSEEDAARKIRIALALQPIVTAIFANSPFVEKQIGDRLCERSHVWLNVDPDRCGILPFAWEKDFSYQRYIEWALDVPMFLIKRDHKIFTNTGQTFGSFIHDGYKGIKATRTDWDTHLSTLFPEVRLKNTLEVRGADAQTISLVCALPAIWKGLLYSDEALDRAESLITPLNPTIVQEAREEISRNALRARLGGRWMLEWAAEVVEIAYQGLKQLNALNHNGEDETVHLARLRRLIGKAQTPAEAMLEQLDPMIDLQQQLIDQAMRPGTRTGIEQWIPNTIESDSLCYPKGSGISGVCSCESTSINN